MDPIEIIEVSDSDIARGSKHDSDVIMLCYWNRYLSTDWVATNTDKFVGQRIPLHKVLPGYAKGTAGLRFDKQAQQECFQMLNDELYRKRGTSDLGHRILFICPDQHVSVAIVIPHTLVAA